jgi:hypothetical protein
MIIKKLDKQSPKAKIWDPSKKKILFTFVNGEFETNDAYIIDFWAKHFDSSISVLPKEHESTEKPSKKRGRPAKEK